MNGKDASAPGFTIDGARITASPAAPGLHIVATPIGNLADITLRALSVLAGVDRILCEDTRVTSRLLKRYAIRTPMGNYHDHNAAKARPRILADLARGMSLALVSDAGTPLVSDPGFKLVREAIAAGIDVHMVPGPSAPVMALALSGLPSDRFLFAGFVPQAGGRRNRFLAELAGSSASLVLFETGHRLDQTLKAIAEIMGEREIAVARELTKLHEEVLRGGVSVVRAALAGRTVIKGEITLVIAPPDEVPQASGEEIDEALAAVLESLPAGRAAAEVARRFHLPRNEVYQRALTLKGQARDGGGHGDG